MATFQRGGKDIERNDCSVSDDAQYYRESFHGSSLLVDLLACELGDGYRGCVLPVHAEVQDHPKIQKLALATTNMRKSGIGSNYQPATTNQRTN